MQTYTLVVSETDANEGIVGEVYNESGTIEESVGLEYEEFGLTAIRDDWKPQERRTQVSADVTTLNLELRRTEGAFEFRLLGDASDELAVERVADADWKIAEVGE